jgi:hypothetical protein
MSYGEPGLGFGRLVLGERPVISDRWLWAIAEVRSGGCPRASQPPRSFERSCVASIGGTRLFFQAGELGSSSHVHTGCPAPLTGSCVAGRRALTTEFSLNRQFTLMPSDKLREPECDRLLPSSE